MGNFVNIAFDIVSFSAIIVLVVLGLGVIASMMGIFNFAHGEFVLLGAYVVFLFHSNGLPAWAGMLVAPFVVGAIGYLLERTVIHRFYATPVIAMLGTYALGLTIREIVRSLTGGLYHAIPEPLVGSWSMGDFNIAKWRAVIIVVTLLVIAATWVFLTRSSYGLRVRASLENPSLARASGISTARLYAMTFAFGAALAGLAGALMVPLFSLYADLGVRFLIQSFLAVMLGGVGTFEGPILGGAIVGGISASLPWLVPPVLADVLVFVIAITIVKLRPQGLLKAGRI
ncbi:branched-chain amino acid transport system permease protein [Skermanella aerolata]|jgi:branched-chain amino acid transport system permease protein|uniref:branched-chain amino acid ABC transporter permease n=1 Tax=Skermanella aerolata TaxID=393310 RepID=UPI003D1EF976